MANLLFLGLIKILIITLGLNKPSIKKTNIGKKEKIKRKSCLKSSCGGGV